MNYINLKRYVSRWIKANPDAETAVLLLLTATHAVAEESGHSGLAEALRGFDIGAMMAGRKKE